MVGMFVSGQGQACQRDLGLKGKKGKQWMGMEGNREFVLDFVCVGEDECWEQERRVQQ